MCFERLSEIFSFYLSVAKVLCPNLKYYKKQSKMPKFKTHTIPHIPASPEEQCTFLQKKLNDFIVSVLRCQVKRGHPMEVPFVQKPCVAYVL